MSERCVLRDELAKPFRLYGAEPEQGTCVNVDWLSGNSDQVHTCRLYITLMSGLVVACDIHSAIIEAHEVAEMMTEKIARMRGER